MRPKKLFIILILSLVLLPVTPVLAADITVEDIAGQLMCSCDCGIVLSECECDTQEEMVTIIEQQLAQGKSQQEILDYFVAQYGDQILVPPTPATTPPPKQDSNLVLWALALIGILAVGVVIYLTQKKRVGGK
jgi:cytochrome c-type biogenesis protein CcmH